MAVFSGICGHLPTWFDNVALVLHIEGVARKLSNVLSVDGKKLTDARLGANLSQQDIADKLLVPHKSTVSRWEQGKMQPRDDQIEALARVLKTRNFILNDKTK
jgi:ribosome-binding protein aMBF1 (putative translation factor)